ncbi:GNAT family N-acetyltransferase [Maribacter sp. HTCC2170]|uniref:GNAT family N-acetyltransferase n=1 Tax=Maribacter sp. (strain HTCC2170 / KCCM 42371) TaxID=313603 RepID=UPI00006B4869|nr:GNAT family N-acetyltransferase [Maribacter sp. HTCC2170]EAR01552.1 acetyltransferase [Maribacter sp. HTCC2170]
MVKIEIATIKDLNIITPLFDQYRVFYKQASNLNGASRFLKHRIKKDESTIFIAFYNDQPAGFTQLYPMFSSVSMQRSYVLNDLFVVEDFRNKKIGEALLNKAKEYCIQNKAKGLALETAIDNPAQKLYEKLGWIKDVDCFYYFWTSNQ